MSTETHDLLDDADLAELFGEDNPATREGSISLADGRVLNVRGVYSRNSIERQSGRAGVLSRHVTFTFPTRWCEDVAEGDGVRLMDVDYTVKGPPAYGGVTTILTLARVA